MTPLQERLFALKDEGYKAFQCPLMPTVDPATVIGVRVPVLRKLAKEFAKSPAAADFLRELPHAFYEENALHAMLLSWIKDADVLETALEAFLPYVDNWGVCDGIRPKVIEKNRERMLPAIRRWLGSDHPYTVRFAMEMLMTYYLDEGFSAQYPAWVATVKSSDYYVNMMIAWYFATALAKQYEAALPFLENKALDDWTHNKAIQKAVESYRISPEQKAYLRTLKVGKRSCAQDRM